MSVQSIMECPMRQSCSRIKRRDRWAPRLRDLAMDHVQLACVVVPQEVLISCYGIRLEDEEIVQRPS